MKKLVALLAILGFVPQAYAAEGADISWSGEYRLQYQNDMNMDLNDDGADSPDQGFHQRTRLGATVRGGEKLSGHFTFVHNADWGSNGGADQYPGDVTIPPGTDAAGGNAGTHNLLTVNEAYMNWMINDATMLRAGRGSFTMADGKVVSANEWENVWKAFDGVLLTYDHEFARFGLFGVVGADLGAVEFNSFGRFNGLTVDFKTLPDWLKTAHVHYMTIKTDLTAVSDKEDTSRIGLTVAGDTAGVDYSATYAIYSGETDDGVDKLDVDSSMIDVEVGYSMPSVMGLRVHAGYHTDSGDKDGTDGDNEQYDGFHYNRHFNGGLMDVFDWGNLTYMRVGASIQPMDDLTVGLEYFMFSQTEKEGMNSGNAAINAATFDATEDDLGTELDLVVTKKYGNNFSIMGRYGMFSPGDEFKVDNMEDDYSQLYIEGRLTF